MRAGRRWPDVSTQISTPTTTTVVDILKARLTSQRDLRSHAEILAGWRAKQADGQLTSPMVAALIDRYEQSVGRAPR